MNSGRRISPLALTIAALALLAWGPSPRAADDPASRDEIAKLEQAWNDAHVKGDFAALDRLLADDITILVPGMDPIDKAGAIGVFKSGRMKFTRYETTGAEIRVYGEAAIVTGRLQRTRAMGEKVVSDDWRFTKVWVRRYGAWRAVWFDAIATAP